MRNPSRPSVKHLLAALTIPVVATIIVVAIQRRMRQIASAAEIRRAPSGTVALVRKDEKFQPLPKAAGQPDGSVRYDAVGDSLRFHIRAAGLDAGRRYTVDIQIDTVSYSVVSRSATPSGELEVDTIVAELANGTCVGTNYRPPSRVAGSHRLAFVIKRDGNPSSGHTTDKAAAATAGASLPCSGNGDGDYRGVLFEAEPVIAVVGTGATR